MNDAVETHFSHYLDSDSSLTETFSLELTSSGFVVLTYGNSVIDDQQIYMTVEQARFVVRALDSLVTRHDKGN
jgi:calcineurin-like phosphoesterase